MRAKLVKFDDDGTQCKRDIEYLRRHPECGIPFIQDKPFKPDNPKHKFRPHDRNFSIDILDRAIPNDPDIPPAQPIGKPPKIGEAVGARLHILIPIYHKIIQIINKEVEDLLENILNMKEVADMRDYQLLMLKVI